ncbi:hypothetical protein TNCV_538991 [Trichonephila clavipes]|nr:hypothetical protein TNCV_538991 [Trichonephila clavipes]
MEYASQYDWQSRAKSYVRENILPICARQNLFNSVPNRFRVDVVVRSYGNVSQTVGHAHLGVRDNPTNESRCRNCGGGDRGRVAIYRPFGELRRAKIVLSPVWCSRPTTGVPLAHATMNFVGLDLTASDSEPESSCVSAQKSRIGRLERSTTESKGLARTFSKVLCMTGWSFNLWVELQFRNCGNLRKCEIPSWTHTLHSSSPSQKCQLFHYHLCQHAKGSTENVYYVLKKDHEEDQYVQAILITNVTPISEMLNREARQSVKNHISWKRSSN